MQQEKVGVLVPGQGIPISPDWGGAPQMNDVISEMNRGLNGVGDIGELVTQPETERRISALNAHRLLTAVVLCVQANINIKPDAVSGHSAGLPLSLHFAESFRNGITGVIQVMENRAQFLEKAQKENPGRMYALSWKGRDGFNQITERIAKHDGIWVACYNWENATAAQVVVTAEENFQVAILTRDKEDPLQLIAKLPIEVGAHSPLVKQAASKFSNWLTGFANSGGFQQIPQSGARFVSDHLEEGATEVIFTSELDKIIRSLASIDRPVMFQAMVRKMYRDGGIRKIYEIGSNILGNMIRRMSLSDLTVISIKSPKDMKDS